MLWININRNFTNKDKDGMRSVSTANIAAAKIHRSGLIYENNEDHLLCIISCCFSGGCKPRRGGLVVQMQEKEQEVLEESEGGRKKNEGKRQLTKTMGTKDMKSATLEAVAGENLGDKEEGRRRLSVWGRNSGVCGCNIIPEK